MKGRIVMGSIIGLFWIGGSAESAPIPLNEVVVTATKSELPAGGAAGALTTVITADDLRRQGVTTVSEALRQVVGLDLVQQGGAGKTTSVFLRGTETDHTLVLIDGIPVNSPTLGAFDFADLTVDNIDRIEIVKGLQSPLYGSDAIGGVIQIFTKKGTASGATLSVEGGSLGTSRESVSTQVKQSGYDMSLSSARWDTEGISALKGGSEKDGYQNTSLSVRFGKDLPARRIDLTGRLVNGTTELDACKFDATFTPYDCDNPAYEQERRLSLVGLLVRSQPRSIWEHLLSANVTAEQLINRDPDPNGINSRIDTEIRTVEWQNHLTPTPTSRLTVGYEWKEEAGDYRGNFNRSITNHGLYLQDHRGIGSPVEVLAGVRWDGNSQYEDAWTWRVLAAANAPGGVRAHLQYGTGFHGPDLNDLFWPGVGNTALKPEKSEGWEAGIQRISGPVTAKATYFQNRFRNLIQWAPIDPTDPFSLWMPQNVGRAESSGWEGEMLYRPAAGFRMGVQYTYDDTENRENGGYLIRRPLNKYSANLEFGGLERNLGVRLLHVGRRFDANGNQNPMGAYNRVDLYTAFRMTERFEAFGRIENLLDKDYEEAKGYGVAGVSSYGGVRMTF